MSVTLQSRRYCGLAFGKGHWEMCMGYSCLWGVLLILLYGLIPQSLLGDLKENRLFLLSGLSCPFLVAEAKPCGWQVKPCWHPSAWACYCGTSLNRVPPAPSTAVCTFNVSLWLMISLSNEIHSKIWSGREIHILTEVHAVKYYSWFLSWIFLHWCAARYILVGMV